MNKKYEILGGIYVIYNNIYEREHKHDIHFDSEACVYEINHCQKGKFECELKDGTVTYMSPGDFSINIVNNSPVQSLFPIGFYSGITIYIDISKFDKEVLSLQQIFQIDYEQILNHICEKKKLFIKRSSVEIQHIFSEIYNVSLNNDKTYLKIKIQELFHYLSNIKDFEFYSDREYYGKNNINIIKKINKFIEKNYAEQYTYTMLSTLFNIKITTMKNCYKFVYNESMNETLRNIRLKKGADLLGETNDSITDISLEVGYSDYSSFSKAFKKEYGISPSEYRSSLLEHDVSKKVRHYV